MIELAATGDLGHAISTFSSLGWAGKKLLSRLKQEGPWGVSTLRYPGEADRYVQRNSRRWPGPSSQEFAARAEFVRLYAGLTEHDRIIFEAAVGTRRPSRVRYDGPQASRVQRTDFRRDGTRRSCEIEETYRCGSVEFRFDDYR